ncbi:nuclear transport factor 2 family protein [Marinomonas sp. 2405UD68-3]|uniref:nuclear transport factor 2 family protein n=1 Tax=Marinomonas sp. 2405UD68-3 TaxID=3391835 RepID=UPI0039C8D703
MKAKIAAVLVAGSLAACSNLHSEETMTLSHKEKAVALLNAIETGDSKAISYVNPTNYTQHNLEVGDGLAAFGEVLQALPKGSAKVNVVRAFQDGDYTFTHTEYNFFGHKAGFDVFRFEEGKIVEHWDNLQEVAPANPSGRTQFDGATELTDLDKTDENKAIVTDFVNSILIKGELNKLTNFISPAEGGYIQHNPSVADDLSGLGAALGALAEQGMPTIYTANHKILGEGNFVLAISEGEFLKKHVAFYDLFRLENGMIVEHWDTIEAIPTKSEWKNNNGKFNF